MIVSLCSGYGGLDRAVAAAFGTPIAAHAEPEKIYVKTSSWRAGEKSHYKKPVPNPVLAVLEARFPGVPNLGDITAVDWTPWRARCTILCAGFPCQPFSAAGRQGGEDDERYLWPSVHRAIVELAPEWVVLENVANIVSIRSGEIWATILQDLRGAGYAVAWGIFGACLVGACHHRHRMFLVARKALSGPVINAIRWDGKPCAVPRGHVLPTPVARDASTRGEGSAEYWEAKRAMGWTGGAPLGAELALLPTPRAIDGARGPVTPGRGEALVRRNGVELASAIAELLPTPQAREGNGSGLAGPESAAARWPSGRRNLDDGVALLPTPTALSYGSNQGGAAGRVGPVRQASDALARSQNFGRFTWAVDRWVDAFGNPPPAPTESGMPGQRGGTRMAAPFPEWMMGLAPGYVTNILPRNDALRAIGNGVMPQQGYAAIRTLLQIHA